MRLIYSSARRQTSKVLGRLFWSDTKVRIVVVVRRPNRYNCRLDKLDFGGIGILHSKNVKTLIIHATLEGTGNAKTFEMGIAKKVVKILKKTYQVRTVEPSWSKTIFMGITTDFINPTTITYYLFTTSINV